MSPSLPISRSSSSSSFYFVHPDKNSPSLNGIPDCTKMAHITVLKESHHSKFQLYICSSSCCWYSSSLQKRLYFRGQIDSQVESVESQIDSREIFWIGAVYLCELLLLYVTYIYLLCYFYTVDDVEQSEMRERFSCYFERVLIEKMAIFE